MAKLNKGLGRGLDALLSGGNSEKDEVMRDLNVDQLKPGRYQPRSHMDEASLNELAASIKAQGIMQPILARKLPDSSYEIIAGERRWRAAKLAGLSHVPVLVRSVPDNAALAMALIENIQREDLNPLEEALGIQRLIDEFKMTHQLAADSVGRSRSAATNLLRLLKLAKPVQNMLMENRLDMGHARALLPLDPTQQTLMANKIVLERLSVRDAENLVLKASTTASTPRRKAVANVDRDTARLEEEVGSILGATITIKQASKGGGKLIIDYADNDQLDEFLSRLKKGAQLG
jgi:ParB family chromosome partitioning protein